MTNVIQHLITNYRDPFVITVNSLTLSPSPHTPYLHTYTHNLSFHTHVHIYFFTYTHHLSSHTNVHITNTHFSFPAHLFSHTHVHITNTHHLFNHTNVHITNTHALFELDKNTQRVSIRISVLSSLNRLYLSSSVLLSLQSPLISRSI